MFEVVLKNPKALTFSVLFHMVIIIAIVINFEFFSPVETEQFVLLL